MTISKIQDEIAKKKAALLEKEQQIVDDANKRRKALKEKANAQILKLKNEEKKARHSAAVPRVWKERDYLVMRLGGFMLAEMKKWAQGGESEAKNLEYFRTCFFEDVEGMKFADSYRETLDNEIGRKKAV